MYLPPSFAERDLPTLHAFLEAHPLAALVSSGPDGLVATHMPFVLDRTSGPMGTLIGHVARANPHARALLTDAASAMAIFTGPDAYVTPSWYRTGRVVPTWNYVAVHAYGTVQVETDAAFLRAHLEALTNQHERGRVDAWQVSDAPAEYVEQQMKAIVAVRLPIDRLEGKWKMSQNRSAEDVAGVIRGLSDSDVPEHHAVAAIVSERRPQS
jgi:transcriptional regulator